MLQPINHNHNSVDLVLDNEFVKYNQNGSLKENIKKVETFFELQSAFQLFEAKVTPSIMEKLYGDKAEHYWYCFADKYDRNVTKFLTCLSKHEQHMLMLNIITCKTLFV